MEEHKLSQLKEQEGKLIDAFASGDFKLVEHRFNTIASFILKGEKPFLDGIQGEKEKHEAEIVKAKKDFSDGIRKAAEIVDDEDLLLGAFKCFEALQNVEQGIMNSYPHDLVESISSYIHNLDGNK